MSADPTNISKGERMFAQRSGHCKDLLALLCALALIALAGCGSSTQTITGSSAPDSSPAPPDGGTSAADPADLKVIEDWSSKLSSGDVEGAARYFATPSTAENGPLLVKIETLEDAIAFNESLPCGAKVISARTQGSFTNATFRLSQRPGGDCGSGAGGKASTSFQIEDGKIVDWRRVDSPPGGAPQAPGGGGSSV